MALSWLLGYNEGRKAYSMSIGSCTSCTPVADAAKRAASPKADLNQDGKITAVELQQSKIAEIPKKDEVPVNGKIDKVSESDTRTQIDPYRASQNQSLLAGSSLLFLALNNSES